MSIDGSDETKILEEREFDGVTSFAQLRELAPSLSFFIIANIYNKLRFPQVGWAFVENVCDTYVGFSTYEILEYIDELIKTSSSRQMTFVEKLKTIEKLYDFFQSN